MLGDVAELARNYLVWVDYVENDTFIQICSQYMCKNDGKAIKIMKGDFYYISEIDTYKRGILHGVSKGWRSSGQLHSICYYKYGKQNGVDRSWYTSGVLAHEMYYVDGKLTKPSCRVS